MKEELIVQKLIEALVKYIKDKKALLTCLKTMKSMFNRISKTPTEPKYRKINIDNENFFQKVGKYKAAIKIYELMGFEEDEGYLVLKSQNIREERIKHITKLVSFAWNKLSKFIFLNLIPFQKNK